MLIPSRNRGFPSAVAGPSTQKFYAEEVQRVLQPVGSPWATGADGLHDALEASVVQMRQRAMNACEAQVMEEVEAAVDGPAWMTISQMPQDLWLQLRSIIKQALKQSVSSIDRELDGYGCAYDPTCYFLVTLVAFKLKLVCQLGALVIRLWILSWLGINIQQCMCI